jgi:replicative DNA helicase
MAYSDGSGALAPPSDIATEKYVLGGVLHVSARRGNNEFYYELSEQITSDDFFSPPCLTIWSAMKAVAEKGIVVTRQTVTENIKSSGVWVHDQPLTEVMDILIDDASFIAFEIVDYAKLLHRLGSRRRLAFVGQEIEAMALQPGHDGSVSKIFSEARSRLDEAEAVKQNVGEWETAAEATMDEVDQLERQMNEGITPGISTGISKLDDKTGGLHRGDLVVIAGASSMGKTALAMNICVGAARTDGARVALFSQEMTRKQMAWRLASSEARRHGHGKVAYQDLRNGQIGQNQLGILRAGTQHIPKTLDWNTARGLTLADLKSALRRAKQKLGALDVICIDYLQILGIETARGQTKADAIGQITMSLKKIAGEEDCVVVLLSQLKRGIDDRDNKRPRLSDLRESGSIEQDADSVIFAYRDDYYIEREEPAFNHKDYPDWLADMEKVRGKLDAIIGKQRMGPIGPVSLFFEKETDLILDDEKLIDDGGMFS